MSGPTDSAYSEDWLRIARRDWKRVQLAISGDDLELAAFLLQQSLEKYLKAFLLDRGSKLRRIHLLHSLLDAAGEFQGSLEEYRELCERVSGYYLIERYPLLGVSPVDSTQIGKDLSEARNLVWALYPDEDLL